jgi:hypothetical protein
MSENVEAVAVNSESLRVRVAPSTALRTAWKTTVLQGVSMVASMVLLILGYLQTVNIASVVSPTQAMLWIMGINIAQLMLRAFGVKPIVLDPPKDVTVKSDNI